MKTTLTQYILFSKEDLEKIKKGIPVTLAFDDGEDTKIFLTAMRDF